jgi:hypothetical protein
MRENGTTITKMIFYVGGYYLFACPESVLDAISQDGTTNKGDGEGDDQDVDLWEYFRFAFVNHQYTTTKYFAVPLYILASVMTRKDFMLSTVNSLKQ